MKLSMGPAQALERLRAAIEPGDTLYTVLRHRAPSGMSRAVDVYAIRPDPERGPRAVHRYWLSYWIAAAGIGRWSERYEAVTIGGCGMDVGFEIVYSLGRILWPDGGPCTGPACHSNDHSNGDRDYTPGRIHSDGGYTLRQEWIG